MTQVRITARLCFLCWDEGINKVATHAYSTTGGDEYDICPKHKKLVVSANLNTWEIDPIRERGLY